MKNLLAGKKVVEKWKIWFAVPIAIILIACIAFGIYAGVYKDAGQGINVGIDFTGGAMVTVELGEDANSNFNNYVSRIEKVLKNNGANVSYSQLTGSGANTSVVVRYGLMTTEQNEKIEQELRTEFAQEAEGKTDSIVKIKTIGATASKDLIVTAVLSVVISTLLILIYIVIRFKNIYTGLSAVIALLHDVLMVIALTVICHIQINSSFIAAIITVIAYSINNTIVIFDRVRDNYKNRDNTIAVNNNMLVNKSVAQTLTRSINTTVTTLFAIIILAIIGVPSIREFALPVIFGLIAGTFSSIFVAPSLFCLMRNNADKKKKKPKTSAKAKA